MTTPVLAEAEAVLQFWFGTSSDDLDVSEGQASLWWGKDPATDELIRERFGSLRLAAIAGRLGHWEVTARGRLALIVLVDQFSRNLFRQQPEAFAHDALARQWCVDGLARGDDRSLRPIERVFFYLPLEHSEVLDDQRRSIERYEQLGREVPPQLQKPFADYVDFARRHCEIIERFGRFPHRNAVLGRASTPEEQQFLQGPGSSF